MDRRDIRTNSVPLLTLMREGVTNELCSYHEASGYVMAGVTLRNPVMKYLDRLDAALNFNALRHRSSYTSNTI